MKRNLTLNFGVRYDLNGVIKEKDDLLGNFDPSVGLQQVGIDIDAPYKGDHNNFAPRLGIVWDPWEKGNTVFARRRNHLRDSDTGRVLRRERSQQRDHAGHQRDTERGYWLEHTGNHRRRRDHAEKFELVCRPAGIQRQANCDPNRGAALRHPRR